MDGREMENFSSKHFGCLKKKIHSKPPHFSFHIKKKACWKVLLERFVQRFKQWLGVACIPCLYYTFTLRKSQFGPCWALSIFSDHGVVMLRRRILVFLQVSSWKMLHWLGPAVRAWEHQVHGTDLLSWIWWKIVLQFFPLNLGWQMNGLEETWPTCVNLRTVPVACFPSQGRAQLLQVGFWAAGG